MDSETDLSKEYFKKALNNVAVDKDENDLDQETDLDSTFLCEKKDVDDMCDVLIGELDKISEINSEKQDEGQAVIDKGQSAIGEGQDGIDKGQDGIEKGQVGIYEDQDGIEKGQDEIYEGQNGIEKGQDDIDKGQYEINDRQHAKIESQYGIDKGRDGIKKGQEAIDEDEDADDEQSITKSSIDDFVIDCLSSASRVDLFNSVHQSQLRSDRFNFYHKKRHKRKQPRPRSICETEVSDPEEPRNVTAILGRRLKNQYTKILDKESYEENESNDNQNESEFKRSHEIKQRPLCSKLCIRKERRVQKSPVRKEPTITSKEISEIINATNENTTSPCTTNRYRRHFLKQLRKAEARRNQEAAKAEVEADNNDEEVKDDKSESEKHGEEAANDNEDVESEDEYSLDGKKMNIDKMSHDDEIECNVCNKMFKDVGTFMAHYICHSSFEKEHAGQMSVARESVEESSDGHEDKDLTKAKEGKESTSAELQGDSTYFCQVCNQRFNNITSLQSHMSCHSGDEETSGAGSDGKREFYCHLCHKKFASAGSLHVHNKIHTGDNPYTCPKCNKSFRDKTRLTTHIRVHTGEKPYTCSFCYKSFSQKGNLKLHQKIHTGERDCLCRVCGSSFRLKSDLLRHMKVHGLSETGSNEAGTPMELSADERQTCYNSSSDEMLERSIRDSVSWITSAGTIKGQDSEELARKGEPLGPDLISIGLPKRVKDMVEKDLDRILPELAGFKPEEKNLMLSIDSEVEFIKAMTLAKMRSSEETSVQTIPCPLCGIVLTSVDHLNHHVLLHHNPLNTFGAHAPMPSDLVLFGLNKSASSSESKNYNSCKECGIDFSSFTELQAHLKSHDAFSSSIKLRDAKCSICSALVAPDDLAAHLSSHTGEKTYSCPICAKVFRRSHHLQTHLRTHTGDRPYICADCGKCFVRGDHLQNHRRTHTGEKPYSCDQCSKSYSQSHHLLRHKRTHTGERPYRCMLCTKTFSRDHHLKKHMETHKCVGFPDKSEDISKRSSSSSTPHPNPPPPSVSMVTRSSNRIAQMMSGLATDHSASRLMESMVKKHLLEQEKTSTFVTLDDHHVTLDDHHVTLDDHHVTHDNHHGTMNDHRVTMGDHHGTMNKHDGTIDDHHVTMGDHHGVMNKHHGTMDDCREPLKNHHVTVDDQHSPCPRSSNVKNKSKVRSKVLEKKALKISDILDEDVPTGPQLSEKLVFDHVIRATRGTLGRMLNDSNDEALEKLGRKRDAKGDKVEMETRKSRQQSLQREQTRAEDTKEKEEEEEVNMEKLSKLGIGRLLTLEDIVNQRLRLEYNL